MRPPIAVLLPMLLLASPLPAAPPAAARGEATDTREIAALHAELARERRDATLLSALAASVAMLLLVTLGGLWAARRRSDAVRASNAELEQALAAKTQFLATTSHEIRTPLNGILGMTQLLLAEHRLDAETRERIELVHGAGETMKALVDDILDVAKMRSGALTLLAEPTELHRILDDAARLWRGTAARKGLALDADIAGAPQLIRSDPTRVRQILFNLLSNAVKFTAAGRVGLQARVLVAGGREWLRIAVSDSGIGIPHDECGRIFDPFHQVDGGTTRQFGGTGLGLAICRNLARAMGGDVTVESVVGAGSTFTLSLPIERLDHGALAPADRRRTRPARLGDAAVLLVERNAMKQGVLRALLQPAVGSLDCTGEPAAAEQAIARGAVDHVLIETQSVCDDAAPIDALRRLVDAAGTARIPVSLLHAATDALPLDAVARLGATQLILKPIGGIQLIDSLRTAYSDPQTVASPRANAA